MSRVERIQQILSEHLQPMHLNIENESYMHNVPPNSETHFKITAIADNFNALNLVARHQLIYNLLQQELTQGLHALSLHLYTPKEWDEKNQIIPNSPTCRNGKNREN
jgi:BolA family transcriptional regulator, general stress-responsive regulator